MLQPVARWLSWLKRLTSNEEIPSSNLGRAFLLFLFFVTYFCVLELFNSSVLKILFVVRDDDL